MSRLVFTGVFMFAAVCGTAGAQLDQLAMLHTVYPAPPDVSISLPAEAENLLRAAHAKKPGGLGLPSGVHLYMSQGDPSVLIELCTPLPNREPGLYIFRADQVWHYRWFNAQFMDWVCENRSTDGGETSYYAIWENDKTGFRSLMYHYRINLEAGFYYLRLGGNGKMRIVDHDAIDLS